MIQRPSHLLIRHLVFNRNRHEETARLIAADLPLDQEDDRIVVGGLHGGDDIIDAAHGLTVHFDDEVTFTYPIVVLAVSRCDSTVWQDFLNGNATILFEKIVISISAVPEKRKRGCCKTKQQPLSFLQQSNFQIVTSLLLSLLPRHSRVGLLLRELLPQELPFP